MATKKKADPKPANTKSGKRGRPKGSKKEQKPKAPVTFNPSDTVDGEGFAEVPMSDIVPAVEWTEPGQTVVGTVMRMQENIGENDSRLMIFRGQDGEFSVWENKGLEKLFDLFETVRSKTVKILYYKDQKVKGRRQPMRVFKVYVK
jgi:hypothetical protein